MEQFLQNSHRPADGHHRLHAQRHAPLDGDITERAQQQQSTRRRPPHAYIHQQPKWVVAKKIRIDHEPAYILIADDPLEAATLRIASHSANPQQAVQTRNQTMLQQIALADHHHPHTRAPKASTTSTAATHAAHDNALAHRATPLNPKHGSQADFRVTDSDRRNATLAMRHQRRRQRMCV